MAALTCSGADKSECADEPLLGVALGGATGLMLGALAPRTAVVYRRTAGISDVHRDAQPTGSLDALALAVNLGDVVRIEDRAGRKTTGRLARLTGEELAIDTRSGGTRFTASDVRAVAMRRYRPGRAALVGAAALGGLALAAPPCRRNTDCQPLAAAGVGAGLGAFVGAVVPRVHTVFTNAGTRLVVVPTFRLHGVGLTARAAW